MADPNELVSITLTQDRFYRTNDSDTTAVHVPKGEARVPHWVAEAWGIAPMGLPAALPAGRQGQAGEPDGFGAISNAVWPPTAPTPPAANEYTDARPTLETWADQEPEATPAPAPKHPKLSKGKS